MARATGNARSAAITAVMGASGSGKTTWLMQQLGKRKRRRTLVWSPKEAQDHYADMYPGTVTVNTARDVLRLLREAGSNGQVHIVYVPRLIRKTDETQFGAVCNIALTFGNLTLIADELHTVTRPSWAPDGWSAAVMMGRAYGLEVFGLSQRPASVDKDFFGNLSMIHCGRLAYMDDAKAVAPALNVRPEEVMQLTGHQWIEREISTGKITRGG